MTSIFTTTKMSEFESINKQIKFTGTFMTLMRFHVEGRGYASLPATYLFLSEFISRTRSFSLLRLSCSFFAEANDRSFTMKGYQENLN